MSYIGEMNREPQPSAPETGMVLPVFPLPNTVFFPRTTLPLHIFEPRYRQMLTDVQQGNGLVVVAMSHGDRFHDVATVGRLGTVERFDDGRSNIELSGLYRVRIEEEPAETPYRQVRVQRLPESHTDGEELSGEAKLELLASLGLLKSATESETVVLHEGLPFEVMVNATCSSLPIEARFRQELLEIDELGLRGSKLAEYLNLVSDAVAQLKARSDEPSMSEMN
jgi:Lon protease-like protein